jgi:nucleoside-diphosphate-sugar epimerase
MKILFIGGTGVISSASSRLAIERGMELFHLNRGQTGKIRKMDGAHHLQADVRDPKAVEKVLRGHWFDVVVNWVAFKPEHILQDIKLFSGSVQQYVFISSASAYQTPPDLLPVTEKTILNNPFWAYSREKMACEKVLENEFKKNGFPYTIVRPSHTYDKTLVPMVGGLTSFLRMAEGLPVLVHGEGTSIWTLTHANDFALGLVGLLGKVESIGEAYHITSNELLTWNIIYKVMAEALGVKARLVHVPSKFIAQYDPDLSGSLLGDKTHSMIFDNSKIKRLVPDFNPGIEFRQGAKEIVAHYSGLSEIRPDERWNKLIENIIFDYEEKIGKDPN